MSVNTGTLGSAPGGSGDLTPCADVGWTAAFPPCEVEALQEVPGGGGLLESLEALVWRELIGQVGEGVGFGAESAALQVGAWCQHVGGFSLWPSGALAVVQGRWVLGRGWKGHHFRGHAEPPPSLQPMPSCCPGAAMGSEAPRMHQPTLVTPELLTPQHCGALRGLGTWRVSGGSF